MSPGVRRTVAEFLHKWSGLVMTVVAWIEPDTRPAIGYGRGVGAAAHSCGSVVGSVFCVA